MFPGGGQIVCVCVCVCVCACVHAGKGKMDFNEKKNCTYCQVMFTSISITSIYRSPNVANLLLIWHLLVW